MTQILRIPKAAVSMREGTLVAWLAPDGSRVEEGQPLFTLELEKSTMDVESPAAGLLHHIGVAGTTYKVGEIIGEIAVAPAVSTAPMIGSLQRIVQIVANLDDAIKAWSASTGAGPFFVFEHLPIAHCELRGVAVKPDISVASGFSGETMVELVQVHDATASPWLEAGVGALLPSVLVDDFAAALAAQTTANNTVVAQGSFQYGGKFAFVDSAIGAPLMLVEKHFLLTQLSEKMRAAHRNWDRSSLTATLK